MFLTADHGGANVPGYMNDNKIPAGYFSSEEMIQQLKAYLDKIYGQGDYILNYYNEQLFLNRKLIAERSIDLMQIQYNVADFMLQFKGVANAFTSSALNGSSFTGVTSLLQNGYNQKRSGDVLVVLEPGWMEYHKPALRMERFIVMILMSPCSGTDGRSGREAALNLFLLMILPQPSTRC